MADSSDSLKRTDPLSQELAYNNTTDRMKVELPIVPDNYAGRFAHLSANSTNNIVWTPAAGKRFVITDFIFSNLTHGTLTAYEGVNIPSNTIMKFALASGAIVDHEFATPYPGSAINNVLKVDCNPGCSGYLSVWGYEI